MSAQSPTPAPRLTISALVFALSLAAALVFASAFKEAPATTGDPTLCGEPATAVDINSAKAHDHDAHTNKKAGPTYFLGGLWSPQHGLAPMLDIALLAIAKDERPIVCQSAIAIGESIAIIDRTPIQHRKQATPSKPNLLLSIDYAGGISSMAYPGAGALQKYITAAKDNYNSILIVEPLPGPNRDPDEDWTYLNFDGDTKIDFFTPKRKAETAQVAKTLIEKLGGKATAPSNIPALINHLGSANRSKAADARQQLAKRSPYQVIPALNNWLAGVEGIARPRRVYEALLIRRAFGAHADDLIVEAAASEDAALRALAARTLGDLADVTTDPLGKLTPLAEDDDMGVRYEALVATRAIPGRRAAGVAQLVEPYEMTDAMRTVYQGTMQELLTYGEPIQADSKANRLRRLAIGELLKEDRSVLVCTILLERTDLPDDQIDEVLGQLAAANGQGPLVALLNLIEFMNPRTLAQREVLLKTLVDWKTNELNAQTPRLKEMALGNGSLNKRSAAAAAMVMSSSVKDVFIELGGSAVPYEGLAWVKDQAILKRWAEPISLRIVTQKDIPLQTTIAAIDAVRLLPADAVTKAMVDGLLSIAKGPESIDLRFAAIRAINALPASIKPPNIDDLKLTTIKVTAIAGMKYDQEKLTITAGRPVELTLINPDTMEHNLVITLPGRAQEIGVAMSADPIAAAAIGYVPKDNDAVLHYTTMTKPGTSDTIRFFAPTKPGNYEYVCTFPGHYTSMRGILEVVEP